MFYKKNWPTFYLDSESSMKNFMIVVVVVVVAVIVDDINWTS